MSKRIIHFSCATPVFGDQDDTARDKWAEACAKLCECARKLGFKNFSSDEEDVSFDLLS